MTLNEMHKAAYDALVPEYIERMENYRTKDLLIVGSMSAYLRKKFPKRQIYVLDIGCGVGSNLEMLTEEGFSATGIDLSGKMCDIASKLAPKARIINADFISFDFENVKYDGILAKAVLHLFPLMDARRFLHKARSILTRNGLMHISVSLGEQDHESIQEKSDYQIKVPRFKRVWTRNALQQEVTSAGMNIEYLGSETDCMTGKQWLDVWATTI